MPKWRPFTWVILVINILFLVWLIAGVGSAGEEISDCADLTGQAQDLCEAENAGTAVGAGIGAFVIIVLWALVDIILGIIWLVTRPKGGRPCPSCGTEVKAGRTTCPKCGHDFAAAARGVTPPPPPPASPIADGP